MTPKKIAAFAIGPLGGALLGLISLPVIAWLFSQEDVGRIAMLQVAIGFSTLFFSLGLDQSYVREYHEVQDKPALLISALIPGLGLLVIFLTVMFAFNIDISKWLFGVQQQFLSILIAFAVLASFISRFLSLVLRMAERGFAYSMSQLLPQLLLLTIIGSYLVLELEMSLVNLVLAKTSAVGLVCIIYVWNTRKQWLAGLGISVNVERLAAMLRFGLPLIFGGLAFWGLTAVDKIFLRALAGYEELAIYSVSVSFAAAAAIIQSVFSTVWAPIVYKWAKKGEGLENVHKVSRYILAFVVLGFALAGLFSWLVIFLLPDQYNEVQWIVVSCIGYPLLYTLSETTVVGIGISRRSSFSMLAAVLAFVFNLIGNWLLVPIYGAAGAAASTCASFWMFFLLRTEFSIYVWRPIPRVLLYCYTAITVCGAIVFTLWGSELGRWGIGFWILILLSFFIVFKRELHEVREKLFSTKI